MKKESVAVSVIIPAFDEAKTIGKVVEETKGLYPDYEVIVIDDGSTDSTREILNPYKEKIQYIYTKNGGPAHARNVGLKIAKGEYIAFLDSDDLYYPYKIELQSKFLDKFKDVGMVYSEFSAFDDNGLLDEELEKQSDKEDYYHNCITHNPNLSFSYIKHKQVFMNLYFNYSKFFAMLSGIVPSFLLDKYNYGIIFFKRRLHI